MYTPAAEEDGSVQVFILNYFHPICVVQIVVMCIRYEVLIYIWLKQAK
jgi:hypothetical protein